METKSRYEVVADLETKKRDLIREKNGLNDQLKNKERAIKDLERTKADNSMVLDRKIEDAKEELDYFKSTVKDREETIAELIKSMDESLARFNQLGKKE